MLTPKPGEIWQADLGLAGKVRPVVIVLREDPDPPRVLFGYVPLICMPNLYARHTVTP